MSTPAPKQVVILGGGFAPLYAARIDAVGRSVHPKYGSSHKYDYMHVASGACLITGEFSAGHPVVPRAPAP